MINLITLMQSAEIQQDLPTKRELKKQSKEFARSIIDGGNHNMQEVYAQALRLKEAVTVIEGEFKESFNQKEFESYGLKAKYRSGGDTINYRECPIYQELEADLKARQELLKLAQTQDVIDAYGETVPRVSTTPRKSSLAVSF